MGGGELLGANFINIKVVISNKSSEMYNQRSHGLCGRRK